MPLEKNSRKQRVIVGVTGGIAAYKTCELVRMLVKAGHEVRIVMTENAEKFIGSVTLEALSGNPVTSALSNMTHIALAQWGSVMVIAPATANFLAKYAVGLADDALSTEALAFTGRVIVAPAMNTRMWNAAPTQENLAKLKARGVEISGPVSGELACGETGEGKMSEPHDLFRLIVDQQKPLTGKRVLVTSGPTRSYIDSIRYITNRSSGRMGHALAREAESLGADVVLITGPVEPRFARLDQGLVMEVETGEEMLSRCLEHLPTADYVFAAAAVADFRVPAISPGKIPREGMLRLDLEAAPDVLGEMGKRKKVGQIFLGFAAQPGEDEVNIAKAKEKLARKNLDLLALNNVARTDIGFDVDTNEVLLLGCDQTARKIARASKHEIARTLILSAMEAHV